MKKANDTTDAEAIMVASMRYNELFRKTALRKASELGMTKNQIEILMVLNSEGPSKMSEVSDKLCIAREQATRVVHSLKERGFVESSRSNENRKHVIASITKKGERLIENHIAESRTVLISLLEELSEKDREALVYHSQSAADILRRTKLSIH